MSLVPVRRRVAYGEPLPLDGLPRRATVDSPPGEMPLTPVELRRFDPAPASPSAGQPATLSAALSPGMREVWRGPNSGGYALLTDQTNNQVVLYGFPPGAAPRVDDRSASRGMYGNPDGGPTVPLGVAIAAPRELENGDADWDRATGTKDAADRAFEAKVHRLRTGVRMRGWNDANRARYGQPPVGGDGPKAA